MASSYTGLGVELMVTGENAGTWGTKTNTNLNIIEQISGGYIEQAVNGTGATTLTVTDGGTGATLASRVIKLTGTITANITVNIPLDVENFYFIENGTSGAYTVEFEYASGSGSSVTWSATDKGYKIVNAKGNDNTNPDIVDIPLGEVTLNGVETLTNKTLTNPIIANILSVSNGDVTLAPNGTGHATIKGNTNPGTLQLNCEQNTHGIKLTSPAHSANQSYELKFPTGNVTADRFLKVDSVSGSGTTGIGQLSFSEVSGGTSWQTVKTNSFTAAAGDGYFVNTTSNVVTMTLPASPILGDEVSAVDYAGTFDTYNLTVARNGKNIQGAAADLTVATERAAFTLVFTDNTQGWLLKNK